MAQLPGTDSLFLALETEEFHGHTGGLLLLDPSGAPGFGFERIREMLEQRIGLAPRFTWKLKEVPLGLDRPYWIKDPRFSVARHLHRVSVAAPGGIRELADLCGYIFSQKLDRRRPLWEIWYIGGLADGRVALLAKTHHCLLDGVSGTDLGMLLCDLEPDPGPRTPFPAERAEAPEVPGDLGLWVGGLSNLALTPAYLAQYAGQGLRRGLSMLSHALRHGFATLPGGAPRLSFNSAIGARRGLAWSSVPLASVKALRARLDVKINDIILEVCSSAIRRYLVARGEALPPALIATCAVSTRDAGDKELGNKIANMNVACPLTGKDPLRRLQRIHRNAEAAKELTRAIRSTPIRAMADTLPPSLLNLAFRMTTAAPESSPLYGNVVISNVPGPPVPLYSAGARIEALYPLSILAAGQGLNITVLSYRDRLDFGLTVDPDLVPDAWDLAAAIPQAFAELEQAALPKTPARPRTARIERRRTAQRNSPALPRAVA